MYVAMFAFEPETPSDDGAAARLIARIPGVSMAIAGALRRVAGRDPVRSQGALVAFEDRGACVKLAQGTLADTGVRPVSLQIETMDAHIEIPLEPRPIGQRFYALVASFDYASGPGDAIAAERHYLDYHVPHSRQLPGLRGYITGRTVAEGTTAEPRARMGIEIFDSRDALAASFRSEVGAAMIKDGEYVCANVRVLHLDAAVVR
jgi:uncharacterized protein (TIGR02118 family)